MSGGHFEYQQNHLTDMADEIDELIKNNDSTEKNEWGDEIGHHFPPGIIAKFQETSATLRRTSKMVQRIDWLVSGDDGEESFHRQWEEEGL